MGAARRLAAIVFTDIAGFTALTQTDEKAALGLVREQDRLIRPLLSQYRGRKVKSTGDGMLLEFPNALDAVGCAVALQQIVRERNLARGHRLLGLRIGLHVGDVQGRGRDILGDTVNIAARIQPLADVGGICLSGPVYDQVHNKVPYPFARLGLRTLRGVRDPLALYRLVLPWTPGPSAAERPAQPRLAVLPLANISADAHDDYFADGLSEELVSVLSRIPGLRVIARSSVVPYKSTPRPVNQVGAELGVASVLEGSVRKAGNHLRISLTLVDVETQEPTWSQTFDRELVDVFALQSEVAERTADALKLELARPHASGATHRPTPDLVAYDLYLRALVAANEDDGRGLDHAARCFEKATELDPHFAEAFAAWAQAYVAAAGEFLPMREVIPRARQLAERAMELDPELSDAHTAIASIAFQYDHDWGRAETEFREAIRLNPSNVTAHRFFALMLLALNRFDEARELLETALRLDPGGTHRETLALVDLTSGRFGAALAHMESERSRRPSAVGPHIYLGMFYVAAGRRPDALREADTPIAGATDSERFDHALLNALLGRPEAAREVAAKVERGEAESYTSATHLAILYAALGEKERALELLEKDFEEGDRVLWLYYRGVWFDSLRDDPRFLALLRRYDLPVGDIVEAPSTLRTRVARVRRRARVGRTPAGRTVPRAEIRRRPRTRGRTRGGSPRPRRAG